MTKYYARYQAQRSSYGHGVKDVQQGCWIALDLTEEQADQLAAERNSTGAADPEQPISIDVDPPQHVAAWVHRRWQRRYLTRVERAGDRPRGSYSPTCG